MKKIILSLAFVCVTAAAAAQSITSYYMPDAIERRNLNVAFAPESGFVSIPLIGSIDIGVTGNIAVGDFLHKSGGELVTLLDGSVSAADALGSLNEGANFTGVDSRINLVSFGRYSKKDNKTFWSFDLSMRTNMNFSMPYEFFEFVKLGKDGDMGGINLYMESFMDVSYGRSRYLLDDKLLVGARVKFLVGMASASLNISKFDVALNSDQWAVDAAGEMEIYGAGLTNSDPRVGQEFDFDNIEMNGFSPAGYGVGFDFGAEYEVLDNLKVSLAVNDLGFITWSKKSNISATVASDQSFEGVNVSVGDSDSTDEGVDFSFDEIEYNNAESQSKTRFLQANIIAAAEYKLFDELLGVGALYTMEFWRSKTMHNVVISANVRPVSWFTFAASYGFVNQNGLGLALNFSPSWFNFYVSTDILLSKKSTQFIPINQSAMNLSLGLAVPLGKRSLRSKYTEFVAE